MTTTSKNILFAGSLLAGTALIGHAQQPAPQPAQPAPDQSGQAGGTAEQLQQINQELQQIQNELSVIQQEASQEPEIQQETEAYEEAIFEEMKKSAPDMQSEVDELKELTTQLRASEELEVPANERSEEFNQQLNEYTRLKQQLGPVEQQAASNPEVTQMRQQVQEKLLEAMKEVNDQTQTLLDRREQLIAMSQQLQSAQPQPQAQPQ